LRVLPLLLPLVFIVAWRKAGAGTSDLFAYDVASKLIWPFTVLKAEYKVFDIACVGLIGLAVAWLALSRGSRKHGALLTSAGVLALAYCAMPQMLFDSAFADTRLLPVLGTLLVLALAPARARQAQWIAVVALTLFAARLVTITVGWHERGAAAEADLVALDQVPRGSRIAAFAPPTYCLSWQMRGFEHLPSMAIIRREAFVNTQWDTPGAQLMRPIYNEAYGFNDAASVSVRGGRCGGKTMVDMLRALPRERFDYVWVFHAPMPRVSWLRPVFAGPDGQLYAIVR
jgi:hypothetical protein